MPAGYKGEYMIAGYARGTVVIDNNDGIVVETELDLTKEYSPIKVKELLIEEAKKKNIGENFNVTSFSMGTQETFEQYVIVEYECSYPLVFKIKSNKKITKEDLISFFKINEEKDNILLINHIEEILINKGE